MRKIIPVVLVLAVAMAMGSAFAEQKGQGKNDRPEKAQGATVKGGPKADDKGGGRSSQKIVEEHTGMSATGIPSPKGPASSQAPGKR